MKRQLHRRPHGPSLDQLCVTNGYTIHTNESVAKLAKVEKSTAIDYISCSYGRKRHQRPYRIIRRDMAHTLNSKHIPIPPNCRYVKFTLDYPLDKIYHGNFVPRKGLLVSGATDMSIGELCWEVAKAYEWIYATTVMKKIGEVSPKKWRAPLCMNSVATTKNPWGIWGHCMSDLCIEGFDWQPRTRTFVVRIGS